MTSGKRSTADAAVWNEDSDVVDGEEAIWLCTVSSTSFEIADACSNPSLWSVGVWAAIMIVVASWLPDRWVDFWRAETNIWASVGNA